MGLLSGLAKGALAKKVFDEARKPHNQAKLKSAFRSVTGKGGGGNPGGGSGGGSGGGTGGGTGGTAQPGR